MRKRAFQIPRDASPTLRLAVEYLQSVAETLCAKNAAYGDSAGSPRRVFSSVDAATGIRVRIDDKLSRIASGNESGDEDTRRDLVGYLALLHAVESVEKRR